MDKRDLIRAIAADCNVTHAGVKLVLDSFTKVVKEAVIAGEVVQIRRFGTFRQRPIFPMMRLNPNTGERRMYPVRYKPKFIPAAEFVQTVLKQTPL